VKTGMRKKTKMLAELLQALNYSSVEEAALDIVILSARSRYAEFRREVKRFEEQYGMNFATFQRMVEERKHGEDFEQEEDLMAWKFAQEAADYWRQRIEEVERATGAGEALL